MTVERRPRRPIGLRTRLQPAQADRPGPLETIPVGTVSDLIKATCCCGGLLMASALLGSVPIAVIYTFSVDHYVSGLTAGAVKG